MRFTQVAKDLIVRVQAKPRKIELIRLLSEITTDRLNSILDQFHTSIYHEIKSNTIKRAVNTAVKTTVANLETNATQNKKGRITKDDYIAIIKTLSDIVLGNKESSSNKQERGFCEQMIATLPSVALAELGYTASMTQQGPKLKKLQTSDLCGDQE